VTERYFSPDEVEALIPRLTGIVEGSGEPLAMINGMVLGIGDRVEGATLLEIANGSVRLRRADGNETVLQVSP